MLYDYSSNVLIGLKHGGIYFTCRFIPCFRKAVFICLTIGSSLVIFRPVSLFAFVLLALPLFPPLSVPAIFPLVHRLSLAE